MYDETSISLAMHCWLYMSPDRDSRKHAASIIGVLFGGLEENLPQVGPGVKVIAVRSVTIDAINLRVSSILGDETVLDENLEGELYALDCFSKSRHPFSSAFIRFRIYDHVVNALQRQLKNGSPQFTVDVLQTGHILLGSVLCIHKYLFLTQLPNFLGIFPHPQKMVTRR
jgi:hypothetical protein